MKYYWYVVNKHGLTYIVNNKTVVHEIELGSEILYAADRKEKCYNFMDWSMKYHNETLKQHGLSS